MGAALNRDRDADLAHHALALLIREAVAAGVTPGTPEPLVARPRLRIVERVRIGSRTRTRTPEPETSANEAECAGDPQPNVRLGRS